MRWVHEEGYATIMAAEKEAMAIELIVLQPVDPERVEATSPRR